MRHICTLIILSWMSLVTLGYAGDTLVLSSRGPKDSMTMNAAITAIGDQESSVLVNDGLWWITNNVHVPTNMTVVIERGSVLSIATNIVVHMQGDIIAGSYRIFTGSGTVTGTCQTTVNPVWGAGTSLTGASYYITQAGLSQAVLAYSNAQEIVLAGLTNVLHGQMTNYVSASFAVFTNNPVVAGSVMAFSSTDPPAGWLECNGTNLSRTTYATLFAVVSTNFGYTNATTFTIPDLRGRFIRGWNHGAGNDPNTTVRTAQSAGGVTNDFVGSYQADAYASHYHTSQASGSDGGTTVRLGSTASGSLSTAAAGGSETRPKNVYLMYCIKY